MFIIHLTDLMILEPIYRQKQYHFLMKLNKTCHSQAPKAGYILSSSLHARHTLHCKEVPSIAWPGRDGAQRAKFVEKIHKPPLWINVINLEQNGLDASI